MRSRASIATWGRMDMQSSAAGLKVRFFSVTIDAQAHQKQESRA